MTRRTIHMSILTLSALVFPGIAACSASSGAPATAVAAAPAAELSDAERADLLSMWAEEKLAHDVYLKLGESQRMRIFSNIRQAEVRHRDAIRRLIDRYGIDVPRTEPGPGEFTDPAFQKLYDEMIKEGGASLAAALTIGARVEEMDIADLRAARARSTHADIREVYLQLERGSMNHLRAFLRQLDRQGVTFTPKHLTQAEIDAIVNGRGTAS